MVYFIPNQKIGLESISLQSTHNWDNCLSLMNKNNANPHLSLTMPLRGWYKMKIKIIILRKDKHKKSLAHNGRWNIALLRSNIGTKVIKLSLVKDIATSRPQQKKTPVLLRPTVNSDCLMIDWWRRVKATSRALQSNFYRPLNFVFSLLVVG